MKRINVGFYNDTLEKIKVRMEKKALTSQADCIRELVELGLKVEEAAEKNAGQETGEDILLTLLSKIDMSKKSLPMKRNYRKNLILNESIHMLVCQLWHSIGYILN